MMMIFPFNKIYVAAKLNIEKLKLNYKYKPSASDTF